MIKKNSVMAPQRWSLSLKNSSWHQLRWRWWWCAKSCQKNCCNTVTGTLPRLFFVYNISAQKFQNKGKCFISRQNFPQKSWHIALHWGWQYATKKPFVISAGVLIHDGAHVVLNWIYSLWFCSLVVYLFPQHLGPQSFASRMCVCSKAKVKNMQQHEFWKENICAVADEEWVL